MPQVRSEQAVAATALHVFLVVCALGVLGLSAYAQDAGSKAAQPVERSANNEIPAQIAVLETRIRFESNGDSRKEVHTRVRINNELGASQFARLNFDYNRSFQQIELPFVRITHVSGGTADILPSAITDQPNPAVVDAPAYQDIRVKSLRILGLAPGDTLEYRVVTTTSHHPLAPDFWLSHSFSHDALVSEELFEVAVPAARKINLYKAQSAPAGTIAESTDSSEPTVTYRWKSSPAATAPEHVTESAAEPEVVLTTFSSWAQLCRSKLAALLTTPSASAPEITARASALTRSASNEQVKVEAIYDFVAQKIKTVDLAVGSTGFRTREPAEVLSSGYATPEDKLVLFSSLVHSAVGLPTTAALASTSPLKDTAQFPRPSAFDHVLARINLPSSTRWLDLSAGVAPFGMIPSQLRGQRVLLLSSAATSEDAWREIPKNLPFAAVQKVYVSATLDAEGTLNAKVRYSMRGDNELLLRIAFHQAPRAKWNDVAQLLAISDGFRGKVTSASASDPYATKQPFTVEYEIGQPKFVDWTKTPVRIPALLPLLSLPDAPAKTSEGAEGSPIELGTPLDVETHVSLHFPAGTTVQVPVGSSVTRDYATFTSRYLTKTNTATATRHINFIQRQIPADRGADYNAFVHAVQSDQAQRFTLIRGEVTPATDRVPHEGATSPRPAP